MKNILEVINPDLTELAAMRAGTSTNNYTAQVQAVLDAGEKVLVEGIKLEATHLDITKPGSGIVGQGPGAIIHQISGTQPRPGAYDGLITVNYANNATPVRDVEISNIELQMDTPTGVYSAPDWESHLVLAGHTENLQLDNVKFKGWRGDALFLGAQMSGVYVPSNYVGRRTTVNRCIFDGINNSSRQAITVGSVDGLLVMDSVFRNVTNAEQPGAIDIEPELPYAYARNIKFLHNEFECIGPVGSRRRAMVIDLGELTPNAVERRGNIQFIGNYVTGSSGFDIFGGRMRGVTFRDNWIFGSQMQNRYMGIDQLSFINNTYEDCGSALIGYGASDVKQLSMRDNRYIRCGQTNGALMLHVINGGYVRYNHFIDCGGSDAAIVLAPGGSTTNLDVSRNEYSSPGSVTPWGARVHSGHTRGAASRIYDNLVIGSFPAIEPAGLV